MALTTVAATERHVVFLVDKDLCAPTGDSEKECARLTQVDRDSCEQMRSCTPCEQAAGQFGRVVVQCSERVAKSTKAAKKAVKKKAYKKRKAAEAAKARALANGQPWPPAFKSENGEDEEEEVSFSYSVSYFNWAVSDSESDSDDVTNVTLPLKNLQLLSRT